MSGVVGASFLLLMVYAAGVGCAAAAVTEVAARIADDVRWSWVAAGLALYSAVVLPIDVLAANAPHLLVVGLVAQVGAMALLAVALHPPARPSTWAWALAAAAAALGVAVLAVSDGVRPGGGIATMTGIAASVAWVAVAVGHVVDGHRSRSPARVQTGLALLLVGSAELARFLAGDVPTLPLPAALALAGLLGALVATAGLVARSLASERARQWGLQEELAALGLQAQHAQERAAERDHELRNGLAALVGITHLLRADADRREQECLRAAALSEMDRLNGILERTDLPPRQRRPYLVEPVLAGLAALRRSAGRPVSVDVDTDLWARGDPAVLAQVITNVFANCDRHAPGTPVIVRAYRSADDAVVELRDEGPGLRAALESELLRPGVHDPAGGGSGLGLHISARLIEREGGQLDLRTVADPLGCLVTVRVPAAA